MRFRPMLLKGLCRCCKRQVKEKQGEANVRQQQNYDTLEQKQETEIVNNFFWLMCNSVSELKRMTEMKIKKPPWMMKCGYGDLK